MLEVFSPSFWFACDLNSIIIIFDRILWIFACRILSDLERRADSGWVSKLIQWVGWTWKCPSGQTPASPNLLFISKIYSENSNQKILQKFYPKNSIKKMLTKLVVHFSTHKVFGPQSTEIHFNCIQRVNFLAYSWIFANTLSPFILRHGS